MSSLFYQKSETPCIIFHLPFTGDLNAISADVMNTIKRVLRTRYMGCIEDSDTGTRYWLNLVDGEVILYGGGSGEITASDIAYVNTSSGLTADDVQDAIDEVNTKFGEIDASDIDYDNTDSGLTADDVQDAIDEVNTKFGDIAASDIDYDNTDSGLTADDVQDAVDELANKWSFPELNLTGDNDEIILGEEVNSIIAANSPFIFFDGNTGRVGILYNPDGIYDGECQYYGIDTSTTMPYSIELQEGSAVTIVDYQMDGVSYEYDETTGNYILYDSNS